MASYTNINLKFIIFLVLPLFVVLYYLDVSPPYIVSLLFIGLLTGICVLLFNGYVVPSRKVFKARFFIHGLGRGLFCTLIMVVMNCIDGKELSVINLLKIMSIAIPMGVLINGGFLFLNSRKRIRRIHKLQRGNNALIDKAVYSNPNSKPVAGLLELSNNTLLFYADKFYGSRVCFFERNLDDLEAELALTKYGKIPMGLKFKKEGEIIRVNFPKMWLKELNKSRKA